MRKGIITGASLFIGALSIISLMVNFRFGWELGKHNQMLPFIHDGYLWGAASLVLDGLKMTLPILIAGACMARGHSIILRGVVALGCLGLWVPITGYSFNSAFGTALTERHDNKGSRAKTISTEDRLKAERAKLLSRNPWTAQTVQYKELPSTAIEQQIAGMKANPIWQASDECKEPQGKTSLSFCQLYFTAAAAQQIALGQERTEVRIAEIDTALSHSSGATLADPNAAALAGFTGYSEDKVLTGWALLLALLLEVVPNVGPALFWLALKLLDKPVPKEEALRLTAIEVKPDPVPAIAAKSAKLDKPAKNNVVELHPRAAPATAPEAVMDEAIESMLPTEEIKFQDVFTRAQEIAARRGHVAIDHKYLSGRLRNWGFIKLSNRKIDEYGKKHTVYRMQRHGGGRVQLRAA
jgi:hypothetical protein